MEQELMKELNKFTGTNNYYTHQIGGLKIYLTDGCKYLAEKGAAYWIFDIILSYQLYQKLISAYFQVWSLKKMPNNTWTITCEDGNGLILAMQDIAYSDFPLHSIKLFLVDKVCMLQSEY
ncbi:hypothetical protein Q0590_30905 [Rhodocytophaga aerolata]|uniref:DUF6876 domain-containing protein n=1 Tax=Rhodocytophaga aerolata TaxID=455078 RepID=A0ABT8RF43_9BACT|nr:DUF6876 family protein [Rhodocytophaga aerolata]MDO1450723.1 hypothetical protein [Rhodocytophaga aerolata]